MVKSELFVISRSVLLEFKIEWRDVEKVSIVLLLKVSFQNKGKQIKLLNLKKLKNASELSV